MLQTKESQSIIRTITTACFSNLGLQRWKKSRCWFADYSWFILMVEFQPISGSNAVVLNVGVGLLWYPKDYFSFDVGYRESQVTSFHSEAQFEAAVTNLTKIAVTKIQGYQTSFATLEKAGETILAHTFTSDSLWGNYHRGVISGLNRDVSSSMRYFNRLLSINPESTFDEEIARNASILRAMVSDSERFKLAIWDGIHQTRSNLKLPAAVLDW